MTEKNSILLIKALGLTEQKANGSEKRSILGTTSALITRVYEVYFYILEGWIAPKKWR